MKKPKYMQDKPPGSNAASENGAYFFVQRLSPPAEVVVSGYKGKAIRTQLGSHSGAESAFATSRDADELDHNRSTGVGRMQSDAGGAVALEAAMVAHSHELPLINTRSHHARRV